MPTATPAGRTEGTSSQGGVNPVTTPKAPSVASLPATSYHRPPNGSVLSEDSYVLPNGQRVSVPPGSKLLPDGKTYRIPAIEPSFYKPPGGSKLFADSFITTEGQRVSLPEGSQLQRNGTYRLPPGDNSFSIGDGKGGRINLSPGGPLRGVDNAA